MIFISPTNWRQTHQPACRVSTVSSVCSGIPGSYSPLSPLCGEDEETALHFGTVSDTCDFETLFELSAVRFSNLIKFANSSGRFKSP